MKYSRRHVLELANITEGEYREWRKALPLLLGGRSIDGPTLLGFLIVSNWSKVVAVKVKQLAPIEKELWEILSRPNRATLRESAVIWLPEQNSIKLMPLSTPMDLRAPVCVTLSLAQIFDDLQRQEEIISTQQQELQFSTKFA